MPPGAQKAGCIAGGKVGCLRREYFGTIEGWGRINYGAMATQKHPATRIVFATRAQCDAATGTRLRARFAPGGSGFFGFPGKHFSVRLISAYQRIHV